MERVCSWVEEWVERFANALPGVAAWASQQIAG